jgi:hypothetical protein
MDTGTFMRFRQDFTEQRSLMADGKAMAYASDEDRLQNFKRQGARWGVSPLVVLGVYYGKHVDAIEAYIRDGIEGPEGIDSNIADCANYLDLMAALIEESR